MSKRSILIALAMMLGCGCAMAQSKITPENYTLGKIINSYVTYDSGVARPVMPTTINDYSIWSITFSGVKFESFKTPKRYQRFNPKRDDINNVAISAYGDRYELTIVHKNGKACDMNEFSIRVEGDNLECTEGSMYSRYNVVGSIWDYLDGTLQMDGDIIITHIESGLSTKVHYELKIKDTERYGWNGRDGAFVYEDAASGSHPNNHVLLNLTNGDFYTITGKTKVDAKGNDGRNGRNGYNGLNGMNTWSYKKKDGTTVTVKGTCGTAGGNGEDGGNGDDGGNVFVMVGSNCGSTLTVTYGGGAAGRGGSAGIGGVHGNGSPCRGKAPDGIAGRNGVAGSSGSVQFHYTYTTDLIRNWYANATVKKFYPQIRVNKEVKKKSKSRDKRAKNKKMTEGAVDF